MNVVSLEDHSPRLLADRATVDVASQMSEDFSHLIIVFERGRARIQAARSLGKSLEHYGKAVRAYYEFRGVLSKIGLLRPDELRRHIPAGHLDQIRTIETAIEQLRAKFESPAPWLRATSLLSFRMEGVCRLGEASLLAERARRGASAIGASAIVSKVEEA